MKGIAALTTNQDGGKARRNNAYCAKLVHQEIKQSNIVFKKVMIKGSQITLHFDEILWPFSQNNSNLLFEYISFLHNANHFSHFKVIFNTFLFGTNMQTLF